mmetsp:Transcript_35478/g.101064  ORF Transcript_35478/g.101064 Transcript_35478/m.101064 type:complete len:399 (-) Transcript_35478:196-1392(-)
MASTGVENCDEVLAGLFLGGREAVARPEELIASGVRAVVCCMRELEMSTADLHPGLDYYRVDVEDMGREPIEFFWPEAADFIHSHRSKGQSVLVHCRAGVSRSASTVLAYMMLSEGYSLHDAFVHVRGRRPGVTPNPGFMEKLCALEESHRQVQSSLSFDSYISWFSGEEFPNGLAGLRRARADGSPPLDEAAVALLPAQEISCNKASGEDFSPSTAESPSASDAGFDSSTSTEPPGAEFPDEELGRGGGAASPEEEPGTSPERPGGLPDALGAPGIHWAPPRLAWRTMAMATPWTDVVSAMAGGALSRRPAFDRAQPHPAQLALGRTWRAAALRTPRSGRLGALLGLAVLCRADAAERPGKRLPAAPLVFRFIDPSKTAGSLIRQRGGAAPQPLRGA